MTSRQISLPAVVGEILDIDVMDITVGDRLRPVDPEWAKALAGIINAEGQRTPIEVCRLPGRKGFTLVAGAHRLEAMRDHLCRVHIAAIIVDADKAERRAREISENLWRKGLDPVDRATFVAELYELFRLRDGVAPEVSSQTIAAKALWTKAIKVNADDATAKMAVAYGWDAEIGERLGLSSRTIRRELTLHKRLLPDVVQLLRNHPMAKNASHMAALADYDPDQQREIARDIATGVVRGIAEAKAMRSQKPKRDQGMKSISAIKGNFVRLSGSERVAMAEALLREYPAVFAAAQARINAASANS